MKASAAFAAHPRPLLMNEDSVHLESLDAAFEEFQTAPRRDDAESRREALERCFERVPERGRRVLSARFVDELSYQQIGERVGMTIEAVRKALFRLKRQVRSCVETSLRTVP